MRYITIYIDNMSLCIYIQYIHVYSRRSRYTAYIYSAQHIEQVHIAHLTVFFVQPLARFPQSAVSNSQTVVTDVEIR